MSNVCTTIDRAAGGLAWWRAGFAKLHAEARMHRWVFVLIGGVWTLALVRLFVHPIPVLPVMFNWTPSLPYRVVHAEYQPGPLRRGDLVVYRFRGAAGRGRPGLVDQALFKRVAGLPGDVVTVAGRDVFVNGVHVGRAKTHAFDRKPLEPIDPTVIPVGFVYAQGSSDDSFDSRYRSSGLVAIPEIQARVHPVF